MCQSVIHQTRSNRLQFLRFNLLGLVLLVLLLAGCVSVRSPQLELSMQVESAKRPGEYVVSGTTNLPDHTQITVQGIRYLNPPTLDRPVSTAKSAAKSTADYSILARQVTEVSQGKWQATLSLWQVASDGRYQEAWQISQSPLKTTLQPQSEVTFLAVTDPSNRSEKLQQKLQNLGKNLEGTNIHFTPDGEWYLQAQQVVSMGLPTGKTTPTAASTSNLVVQEPGPSQPSGPSSTETAAIPQSGNSEQTTAPLSTAAYFR